MLWPFSRSYEVIFWQSLDACFTKFDCIQFDNYPRLFSYIMVEDVLVFLFFLFYFNDDSQSWLAKSVFDIEKHQIFVCFLTDYETWFSPLKVFFSYLPRCPWILLIVSQSIIIEFQLRYFSIFWHRGNIKRYHCRL